MSFMSAYKQLDNLCRTFEDYPNGISSYIEEMERCVDFRYQSENWKDDYYKLKNLRWKRNQISHANDASEDNMCDPYDEAWLKNFRSRMLDQKDPLAKYYKKKRSFENRSKHKPNDKNSEWVPLGSTGHTAPQNKPVGCGLCCFLFILTAVAAVFLLNLL